MNRKLFALMFVSLFVFSLATLSQEESKEKKWADERISVIVESVQRFESFPEELKRVLGQSGENLQLKAGNDYVWIRISVTEKKDLKIGRNELSVSEPNSPYLIDNQNENYWASRVQYNITGTSTIIGGSGYLLFQIPKKAEPVRLKFIYPYRETKRLKYGQLIIVLPHL